MSSIPGIKQINSISYPGRADFFLLLNEKSDVDLIRLEVRAILRLLRQDLPKGIGPPEINTENVSTKGQASTFLVYTLNAPTSVMEMKKNLEQAFTTYMPTLPGVAEIAIGGGKEERWYLTLAENMGHWANGISASLTSYGRPHISGIYDHKPIYSFVDSENFQKDDGLIPGTDALSFARASHIQKDEVIPFYRYRVNGQESLSLRFRAAEHANIIALADQINPIMTKIGESLPADYHFTKMIDESISAKKEIRELIFRTILGITILIFLLVLLLRSGKILALLLTSLIVNVCLVGLCMYLFGVGFHLYSLAALGVSFGLMVDNAIVVADAQKYGRKISQKMWRPVLSATATTLLALASLVILPEEMRYHFWDFSVVVACCLLASVPVAKWFTPALADLMLPNLKSTQYGNFAKRKEKWRRRTQRVRFYQQIFPFRKWLFALMVLLFGLPVFLLPTKIKGEGSFAQVYNAIIGSPAYQQNIRPYLDKGLGGISRLFYHYVTDRPLMQTNGPTQLHVYADFQSGTPAWEVDSVMSHFEVLARQIQGLSHFELLCSGGSAAHFTATFLPEMSQSTSPFILKSQCESLRSQFSGIFWKIYGVGIGYANDPTRPPSFELLLKGYDYSKLENLVNVFSDSLKAHPRVDSVDIFAEMNYQERARKQLVLEPDFERLAQLDIRFSDVVKTLRLFAKQDQADGFFLVNGKETPFSILIPPNQLWEVMALDIPTHQGTYSLQDVLSVSEREALPSLYRENQTYIRRLRFFYQGGYKSGRAYAEKRIAEMKQLAPPQFEINIDDSDYNWSSDRSQTWQIMLLLLILGLLYALCMIIFESFRKALVILAIVPISILGALFAFYFWDVPFDQGGFASLIVLCGISVNHVIFLKASQRIVGIQGAVIAVQRKFLPLTLTTLSTCATLLPVLFFPETAFWYPFAVGVCSGLLFAHICLMLMYPLMEGKGEFLEEEKTDSFS